MKALVYAIDLPKITGKQVNAVRSASKGIRTLNFRLMPLAG
jgi:hypothetical protein